MTRTSRNRLKAVLDLIFDALPDLVVDVYAPHETLAGLLVLMLADYRLHRLHSGPLHLVVARLLANLTDCCDRRLPRTLFQPRAVGTNLNAPRQLVHTRFEGAF